MAIKVRRPGQQVEYVLAADRGSEVQTKFILRPLKWYEMDEINKLSVYGPQEAVKISEIFAGARAEGRGIDQMNEAEKAQINAIAPFDHAFAARLNRYYGETVKLGLVAVQNVLDDNGNPVPMKPGDFIEHAEAAHLHELGMEILRISRHTEDEAKK